MKKDESAMRQTRKRIAENTLRVNYFIGTVRMNCGKMAKSMAARILLACLECATRPSKVLRGDYLMPDSIVNELGEGMEAELEHDLRSVRLDRPDCNSQRGRDLLICFPLGQELDDFNLARSDSGTCPLALLMLASRLEKSFQHDFGYLGGEETLTVRNGFHGFREAVREIRFQKVSASSSV
jgi:hypothetical protein